MIATKQQALEAMYVLFGGENPCEFDLSDRESDFFHDFIKPFLDDKHKWRCVLDALDELDPAGSDHEEDWVDEKEIEHRLRQILRDLGLDEKGTYEPPEPIRAAFGGRYIPGEVRLVPDVPHTTNGLFLIFTSWYDLYLVTREYNRRHNRSRFKLWDPILMRIATEYQEFPWSSFTLGYDKHFNIVHEKYAAMTTNMLGRPKKDTFPVQGLVTLDELCEFGFNDSWDTCDKCFGLIRTVADCHAWLPDFYEDENTGEIYCGDCVRTDEDVQEWYIESRLNQNKLVNILDPSEHGFVQVDMRLETGLHPGQRDDPEKVIEALQKIGVDCVFTASKGQFDVNWYAWVRDWEHIATHRETDALAKDVREGTNVDQLDEDWERDMAWAEWVARYIEDYGHKLSYDPGRETTKALRGEGSEHVKVRKVEAQNGVVTIDEDWKE